MTWRAPRRLSDWLAETRTFLRVSGALGLAAVLVLTIPGNPFLDLGLRKYRAFGIILSHGAMLSLMLGFVGERHGLLEAAARWSPVRAVLTLGLVGAVCLAALEALARVSPAYVRLLLWESGPIEPSTVVLFLVSAWIASVHARLRRSSGVEYRPYLLVTAVCILLMLEEVDYFGIFGNLIGRIEGTYIGTPHDLLKLVPDHPAFGVALGGLGIGVVVALWWFRLLTGPFIRREALDTTSGPLYLGGVLLVLAQLDDLHIASVTAAREVLFSYRVEEPLEMLGALWICLGLLMKYGRDRKYAFTG